MQGAPRTIVLTGATHGLGRALARRFQDLGHAVLGCGRSAERATGKAFQVVDVTDEDSVAAWARTLTAGHGAPDLLINNAGWIHPNANVWEIPDADFRRVVATNLEGPARVLRHFVPAMIENGAGIIVNLSSGWGRSTAPEVGGYCATKWAIEGLTRSLASELAALPGAFAAVALNPGVIHTRMLESCFGAAAESCPAPEEWAVGAAEHILSLGPSDNGRSLDSPQP